MGGSQFMKELEMPWQGAYGEAFLLNLINSTASEI